jgi:DNA-binding MurR/RpiR family transcriptional regulator
MFVDLQNNFREYLRKMNHALHVNKHNHHHQTRGRRQTMMATSSRARRSVSRDRNALSEDRLNNAIDRIEEGTDSVTSKKLITNSINPAGG